MPLNFTYSYDKASRLLNADYTDEPGFTFDLLNTYDKDGNHTTMQRYGTSSTLLDNFNYDYFSGTNKLKSVRGMPMDDFEYDYNGNVTSDLLSYNYEAKYDFRNLLIEIKNTESPNFTFWTRYYYDEVRLRRIFDRQQDEEACYEKRVSEPSASELG